jgi:Histidine kinase-, DNA gyrase B-, and HSP90-like ATPase
MIGVALAQPIRGSVAKDGRLVFADDALRRLHHRAGGTEGSQLAIPALATLAALAHQLKMRLSRSVKVADVDEDLELWVEVQIEGDLAKLSILSWRALPTRSSFGGSPSVAFDEISELRFDAKLRLIGATGAVAGELHSSDFGRPVEDIFAKLVNDRTQNTEVIDAIQAHRSFASKSFELVTGAFVSVSGIPQLSGSGELSGYSCQFTPVGQTQEAPPAVQSSGILFGRQLAPVLRQPLGRIIANAETIGNELSGPIRENYALYAKDIANAARHLVALVDDLGDLEAVERADFVTARDNIELGDLARRVAGLLALKAADHSIRIVTPSDAQKVPAVAEFRRVLQILLNLVTNAVRYSPDGTEVFIDIAASDDASFVMVSDQGAGITPADRERVFEKFERLGRSGDGGSGLGLYISRTLARAMGGDLTVDSAASGGAKFTLRLPSR